MEHLVEALLSVCCNDANLETIDCPEPPTGGCETGNGPSEPNDVED